MRVEQLREQARGLAAVLVERRRSLERDRGQLLDAGVVANLEADAARFREELDAVVVALAAIEPASEQLLADEEAFRSERSKVLDAVAADATGTQAASAAAEVRGELRSVRASHERAAGDLRRFRDRFDSLAERRDASADDEVRFRAECEAAGSVEEPLVAELERAEAAEPKPSRLTRRASRCATTPPTRSRDGRRGSRRCSWRSTLLVPAPAPSGCPASTACSARCSTSSRSTTAGSPPSRRHSVNR